MSCSSCGYNPCSCNNNVHSFNWNTVENCEPCSTDVKCRYEFPGACTFYNGPALTCLGLGSHINYDTIIASIHSVLCTLLDSNICVGASSLVVTGSDLDPNSMILTWIPGGGSGTAQRVLRIALANGTVPNLTTTFTPANDLSAVAVTAVASGLLTNTIYRFKVQTICPVGGPIDNSNGVKEGIIFECLANNAISVQNYPVVGTTQSQIIISPPNLTPIDGGAAYAEYSNIIKIEMSVYNAANTVQVKPPVIVTPSFTSFIHTFTNLSGATLYTLRYVLISEIDGVEVRSDNINYLEGACTFNFGTTGSGFND